MSSPEFSSYVRQRAESLGLSMAELARQSGISRQALYCMLDGSTGQARVSTLIALARALQVHPVVVFRQLLNQLDLPRFSASGAKYQFDASGFVTETLPDHSVVYAGQSFCKTWEIQNIGHVAWLNRRLVCMDRAVAADVVDGVAPPEADRRLQPSVESILIPDTLPGDSVVLTVEFTAPAYPCSVLSYWKMADEQGEVCFPQTEGLSCLVRVVAL